MRTKGAKNKPKLVLKELPNTVVHVPTKAEYDELMDIYTKAGWKWDGGELPNESCVWNEYEAKTCIDAYNSFQYAGVELYNDIGCKIISLSEFKKLQGLEPKFKVGDFVYTNCIYPDNKTGDMCLGRVVEVMENLVFTETGTVLKNDVYKLPAKKRGRPKKILSGFGEAKFEIEPLKTHRGWVELTQSYEDILPSPRQIMDKINEIINSLKKQ